VLEPHAAVAVDSRPRREAAAPGAAIEAAAGWASDLESGARWLRASARGLVAFALAPEHDLTFTVRATAIEGAASAEVPFVERVVLGGEPGDLAGFPRGRLHGDSAAIVHARYRWGLDTWLDAALHVEAGNVFGRALSGFDAELARLSFGVAIDGVATDAHRFGLLLAFATAPLRDGAGVESGHVRFFVGSPPR
jgi:hypothetical protein